MNAILNLGKWLFAIPFAVFGVLHFMGAKDMAGMAPGGEIMVYIVGVALLLAGISMMIGKMDKLAAVLLALLLLIIAGAVHLPAMSDNPNEMGNILKNVIMAGAALMYAKSMAKDNAVIG